MLKFFLYNSLYFGLPKKGIKAKLIQLENVLSQPRSVVVLEELRSKKCFHDFLTFSYIPSNCPNLTSFMDLPMKDHPYITSAKGLGGWVQKIGNF